MAQHFPYMTALRELIRRSDRFQRIAEHLKPTDMESAHYDLAPDISPIICTAQLCRFPAGYVASHFEDALIRTVLSADEDGKSLLFAGALLQSVSMEQVIRTIRAYSVGNVSYQRDAEKLLRRFLISDTAELCSTDYSPEYTWISVKDDTILLVYFSVLG